MDAKVVMYAAYLAISIALTVWVGRTLSRAGKVFLEDAFADERLAGAVNHLLVVGFYLLNLGYVSVAMRDHDTIDGASSVMEQLSLKVGFVLVVLGAVHFFNLYALGRYRRTRMRQASAVPPMAPTALLPRPPAGGTGHHVPPFPSAAPQDVARAQYHAAQSAHAAQLQADQHQAAQQQAAQHEAAQQQAAQQQAAQAQAQARAAQDRSAQNRAIWDDEA